MSCCNLQTYTLSITYPTMPWVPVQFFVYVATAIKCLRVKKRPSVYLLRDPTQPEVERWTRSRSGDVGMGLGDTGYVGLEETDIFYATIC